MSELVYRLENVAKTYGSREVCRVTLLDVRAGEVLGIVGPNGAGKTTLLRLLNFLEPVTSGELHLDGVPVSGHVSLEWRRRVTTVFQEPALLSTSVWNNVAYGLRVRGEKDVRQRVERVLEMVELTHLSRANAQTLSGGEARRVALARALVVEPQILLMDEPTAHLDPYNGGLIEDIVRALNRERGITMVLVTHNVFQAGRLAHRLAIMLEGRIVEIGPAQEVLSRPKDPRSAAFLRGELVY
ncbi:MAG: phosphate ABC transporter ATP-binding protein [Chloroflexi bacterium]|nr:phosphate ABC transporter ATP-binding protein [Chloroflexota bacterium]